MIIIKDLGTIDKGTYKKRMCIAECIGCGVHSEYAYSSVKNNPDRVCKSCAQKKEQVKRGNGNKIKRLYSIFKNMKTRCYNKNYEKFDKYGGRGIIICDEWLSDYKSFEEWSVNNGYEDCLTIDRINVDGNYEPSNCRWTTYSIQASNTQRLRSDNKTGYRGVIFVDKKFLAQITVEKRRFNLGRYKTAEEAARAYDDFVLENNLEHTLNFKVVI